MPKSEGKISKVEWFITKVRGSSLKVR